MQAGIAVQAQLKMLVEIPEQAQLAVEVELRLLLPTLHVRSGKSSRR